MKELWNVYDKNFNIVEGKTLIRGEPIPDGLYHLVVVILVKHVDGTYLLMQRSPNKHYPLMWDASVGGSVVLGEEPIKGAYRELEEETGIKADSLTELTRYVFEEKHSVYINFLTVVDIPKDSIILQEGETCDYRWIKPEELKNYDTTPARTRLFIK